MKRFTLLFTLLLCACNINLNPRNGEWDCGNSLITIIDEQIQISFYHNGKEITEKGSLQPHNDIGYALMWDKSNTHFKGTSQAIFESSKLLPNRLNVIDTNHLFLHEKINKKRVLISTLFSSAVIMELLLPELSEYTAFYKVSVKRLTH